MEDRVITKKEQKILVDIFKNCSMNAIRDTLIDAGIFDEDFPHFYKNFYSKPKYKPMKSKPLVSNESVSRIIGFIDGMISSSQSEIEYSIYQKLRNYIKYL